MSATLSYIEANGNYQLNLDHVELMLITKLMSHIRLGDKNVFSDAAFNLSKAISGCDETLFDAALDEVYFEVVLEDHAGNVQMAVNDSEAIIEVGSNYDEDFQDV